MKKTCKHLRSKSMFIHALAQAPAEPEGGVTRNSHCWCNCTLSEVGPDDRPAGEQLCQPGRECYED